MKSILTVVCVHLQNSLEDFVEDVYTGLNASGVKVIRDEEEQQYSKKQILSVASSVMKVLDELYSVLLLAILIILEKRGKTIFNGKPSWKR